MIAAVISLAAAIAGLVALLAPTVIWLHRTHTKLTSATREEGELRRVVDRYAEGIKKHKAAVEAARDGELRELHARQEVERQRNELLAKLVELGDPGGLADAINSELSALSTLSDLPGTTSGPTTDGS